MSKEEKKVNSKLVYDGKILQLYKDDVLCPNGKMASREIVRHHGGVCVLAMIEDKIILEKQYRYAYNEILFELPAGKLEKDENPLHAAIRELEEETGYRSNHLESYGVMYPTCGYTDEVIHLFYAKDLVKTQRHLDEDEEIELCLFTLEEVLQMIKNNTIKDAKTICLIEKYLFNEGKINI